MDYTQREFFYNVIGGFRGGAEGAAAPPPFVGACPRTPPWFSRLWRELPLSSQLLVGPLFLNFLDPPLNVAKTKLCYVLYAIWFVQFLNYNRKNKQSVVLSTLLLFE